MIYRLCFYLGIEYMVVSDYEPQDVDRCIACLNRDLIFVQIPYIFDFKVR